MAETGITPDKLEELVARLEHSMKPQQKEEIAENMGLMSPTSPTARGRGKRGSGGRGRSRGGESSRGDIRPSLQQSAAVIGAMAKEKAPILPVEEGVSIRQVDELSIKSEAFQTALDDEIAARSALEDELKALKLSHNALSSAVQTLLMEVKTLKEGNKQRTVQAAAAGPSSSQTEIVHAHELVPKEPPAGKNQPPSIGRGKAPAGRGMAGRPRRRGGL